MLLDIMFTFSVFALSFVAGVFTIGGYALHRLRKFDQARLKFSQEIAKANSAKDRINKAFDICERQFAILSGLEGPQSGPLHGKHKQQMNAELKRLEEEKMTILKSVLADGYDPKLAMINDTGEREAVKLSDFVKRRDLMENKGSMRQSPEPKKKLSLVQTQDKEEDTK